MSSLLSKKDRETLSDYAKVQKLCRIGRRAVCKVDWLLGEELSRFYAECATPHDLVCRDADVAAARAKIARVGVEIEEILASTDDLDLRRKARSLR